MVSIVRVDMSFGRSGTLDSHTRYRAIWVAIWLFMIDTVRFLGRNPHLTSDVSALWFGKPGSHRSTKALLAPIVHNATQGHDGDTSCTTSGSDPAAGDRAHVAVIACHRACFWCVNFCVCWKGGPQQEPPGGYRNG